MRVYVAVLSVVVYVVGCADAVQPTNESITPVAVDSVSGKAQEAESTGPIGQQAPQFNDLIGIDDKKHSLKDYASAKAIVIAFTCNHCPVAVAYEDRLVALQNDYKDKGVQVVAINVNNMEADKLPAMKERAAEKGFNFPYLYDPTQQVGRDYGATVTPHIFLLDGERRIAFVGPVDDNMEEEKITEQYLRDAIDAVLAGQTPQTASVKPFGCGIKYE